MNGIEITKYDTPDLEKNPRQTNGHFHPQIRQRKKDDGSVEEKRVQQYLMDYREAQDDRALYQPTLWWFTSTAFPLIAGTFGPLSSLFSICSLVRTWRIENVNKSHVPDPPWLNTLNACSLLLALIANFILSFGFARRIRYSVAQPLTISLWYLSCTFLIIPISLTCLPRFSPSTNPNLEYSESFYYAIISAILYFTISTLLLLNVIGASRFFRAYPPTFALLTHSQRTLMLQTISFSLYLALGAGVFSTIEGWSFTDGVYWADYTVLTVGLGTDFPLTTTLGRMLLIPYAPLGIALVGLVVGSVMGLVMERAKEKVQMRHLGKERDRWTDYINKRLQRKEKDEAKGSELIAKRPRSLLFCWHHKRDKKFKQLPRIIAHAKSTQHQDQHGKWHRAEFELMRHIQITEEQSQRYMALAVSFLVFLVVWTGGSLVFWATERKHQKWTYPESLYFTYTTLLTIGYGDFFPVSQAGKPFFVAWSLVAVPAMTVLVGNMGDTVVRAVRDITDWTGKKTLLPEYEEKKAKKQEEESGEVKKDQISSDVDRVGGKWPSKSDLALARPAPSFPTIQPLPMHNYRDFPLISSSGGGQEAPAASQAESSLEPRGDDNPPASDPQQSNGENSGYNTSQLQAEATLLAREISKLAKDVGEQPPKKYGWEEWVNWLKILGDEVVSARKAMEGNKIINLPETAASLDTQVEQPHNDLDDCHRHHKHHHRHHSQLNAQLKRGKDGDGWHWTWLDDKGPLFSPQTETEWILSRLCNRLEHLMNDLLAKSVDCCERCGDSSL